MTDRERRPEAAPAGGCGRPDLAVWLPDWETLDEAGQRELAQHADSCPRCGPKWRLVQRTDAFLENGMGALLTDSPAAAPALCPSPDELYDLGRGPGARRLSEIERVGLRAHVAACAECAALIETLRQRPPSPLLWRNATPLRTASARRRWSVWAPLAAAAALLAVLMWNNDERASRAVQGDVGVERIRFPSAPLVRGDAGGALWHPRERLLAGPRGLFSELEFELAPRERAQRYRAELERHDGAVFAQGEPLLAVEGAAPHLRAIDDQARSLAPGHYTWEGWAEVDGLHTPLGRRDFEVVRDDQLIEELERRASAPEPARSESILHLLHGAGFESDARAFARTLPASPERDAYLARRPVR